MRIKVDEVIREIENEYAIQMEEANDEEVEYYQGISEAFEDRLQVLYHIAQDEIEWTEINQKTIYANAKVQTGYDDGNEIIETIVRNMAR